MVRRWLASRAFNHAIAMLAEDRESINELHLYYTVFYCALQHPMIPVSLYQRKFATTRREPTVLPLCHEMLSAGFIFQLAIVTTSSYYTLPPLATACQIATCLCSGYIP